MKVRPRLRAIVQAEHALDNRGELLGDADGPGAATKPLLAFINLVRLQAHAEGALHFGDRSRQPHRALRDTALHDIEPVYVRKIFDFLDILRIGAISLAILFAR